METADDKFGLLRSFIAHRAYLAAALGELAAALTKRANVHDLSKLRDDEFSGFSRINAAARINKFGSPEYAAGMKQEKPTIDLHFSRNRHHPERPRLMGEAAEVSRGLPDDATYWAAHGAAAMTFIDVIEMVCDWRAAWQGYNDTRPWLDSARLNFDHKGKYLSASQRWLAESVAEWLETTAAADQPEPPAR